MKDFEGKYKKQYNYIASRYQFRFNVVTSMYEYRQYTKGRVKNTTTWNKYDDRIKNRILIEIFEHDMDLATEKFNLFIESEVMSPDYNPFEEYFENCKKWDGKKDYIELLANTIQTDNSERFYNTLRKFLVGSLDCLLNEDSVNDVCLVFQAGQGLGKTRWMRKLLPEAFRSEYLYEGNVDTKNKDHVQYLSQYWLIHLDELEALRGNDISAIKSYITRQRISVRKAFGRYKSNFTRRASFIGSVNDDKFLSDITGNRRWLVFNTRAIDYEHEVDVDGLWAQVYHLWKEGFKHWFDIDEIKEINRINEEFRAMSLEEEQLIQLYKFPEDETVVNSVWLSATEVMIQISEQRPTTSSKMVVVRVGKALSKYSTKKKTTNGVQKYLVKFNVNVETEKAGEVKTPLEDDDLPF